MAAQIVRIEPPGKQATRTLPDRQEVPVGVDDLICAGDMLEFGAGGADRIEIFEHGRRRVLVPPQSFRADTGVLRYAAEALGYLAHAVQGLSSVKSPPDIPGPTAARGSSDVPMGPALQIRSMRLLQDLPRQSLTADVRPVLSWRDGVQPYECQAVSELGDVVWRGERLPSVSWCEMSSDLRETVQLAARDGKGR